MIVFYTIEIYVNRIFLLLKVVYIQIILTQIICIFIIIYYLCNGFSNKSFPLS